MSSTSNHWCSRSLTQSDETTKAELNALLAQEHALQAALNFAANPTFLVRHEDDMDLTEKPPDFVTPLHVGPLVWDDVASIHNLKDLVLHAWAATHIPVARQVALHGTFGIQRPKGLYIGDDPHRTLPTAEFTATSLRTAGNEVFNVSRSG